MDDRMVRSLLERSQDQGLRDRIWDYREGTITRAALYTDPAFVREVRGWYAEVLDAEAARGNTPEVLRRRLVDAGVLPRDREASA